jgi:predicted DNA-binding transcriptional regulator AlpA
MAKSTNQSELPDALKFFDSLPSSGSVRQPVVDKLFGWSPATTWRRVKSGLLPQPHRNGRITSWNIGELRDCLLRMKS